MQNIVSFHIIKFIISGKNVFFTMLYGKYQLLTKIMCIQYKVMCQIF